MLNFIQNITSQFRLPLANKPIQNTTFCHLLSFSLNVNKLLKILISYDNMNVKLEFEQKIRKEVHIWKKRKAPLSESETSGRNM